MSKRICLIMAIIQTCLLYRSVDGLKATVCEGGHLPLACPPDSFISVTSAMYGRKDKTICPYANISDTNCSETTKTLSALQALCNGEKNCDVDALSYYFGEPCKGIFKYLTFEYSCLPCVNQYGDDAMCEMWALDGECNRNNSDWMEKYCSKACFKCEDVIESGCFNAGDDKNCTIAAAKGDCITNPAAMGAYCKKACSLCDQPTTCANKANETECKTKSNAGECTKSTDYMFSNCTKSCFNCTDNIKCENKNDLCDTWAMQGKCQSEPGKMMTLCTKSCLGCSSEPLCTNKYSECDAWAQGKECSKNPIWMYRNCWKACMNCSTPHVCDNRDEDALCEAWARDGECSGNPVYMLDRCRLSCTRCKAFDYGRPRCINALFNESQCLSWAQRGECSNNPGFMLTNCYKMCTSCYSPYAIGNSAMPGDQLDALSMFSVVLPYEFTVAAVVNQFTAFIVNTNPIYFQIWRPNGTYFYNLVYSKLVVPTVINEAINVKVTECVLVNSTDQIGFTSFSGPPAVGFTVGKEFSSIDIRESAAVAEGFFSINTPLRFSLSAEFTIGTAC